MTHGGGIGPKPCLVNWRNFKIAISLAKQAGVTTAMITGKGEPTLWPDTILSYMTCLSGEFPLIELQTNGINISNGKISNDDLKEWWGRGLTTVAVSVAHWDDGRNREIYLPNKPEYPPLTDLIKTLHEVGLSVRLNCVMLKEYIDCWGRVEEMANFAKDNKVEQLTLMPVNSSSLKNTEQEKWVERNRVESSEVRHIKYALELQGEVLMELAHGALVFDFHGQNVCLSNCLSREMYDDKSLMRNLIFFPDGHLRYDWECEGAVIL
jgi:molybdenum cofactor biosynthesis enzyme MoaA